VNAPQKREREREGGDGSGRGEWERAIFDDYEVDLTRRCRQAAGRMAVSVSRPRGETFTEISFRDITQAYGRFMRNMRKSSKMILRHKFRPGQSDNFLRGGITRACSQFVHDA